LVALTGIEPDGWQFSTVQFGLCGCVFSRVGIPRWSETPLRTADVTAQSQRGRGRWGEVARASLRQSPISTEKASVTALATVSMHPCDMPAHVGSHSALEAIASARGRSARKSANTGFFGRAGHIERASTPLREQDAVFGPGARISYLVNSKNHPFRSGAG
jgi:hypothetical protein